MKESGGSDMMMNRLRDCMVKGIVGCNYGCFLQSGGDDWGIFCFYCLIVRK